MFEYTTSAEKFVAVRFTVPATGRTYDTPINQENVWFVVRILNSFDAPTDDINPEIRRVLMYRNKQNVLAGEADRTIGVAQQIRRGDTTLAKAFGY